MHIDAISYVETTICPYVHNIHTCILVHTYLYKDPKGEGASRVIWPRLLAWEGPKYNVSNFKNKVVVKSWQINENMCKL
jgi:hypothetical protein